MFVFCVRCSSITAFFIIWVVCFFVYNVRGYLRVARYLADNARRLFEEIK